MSSDVEPNSELTERSGRSSPRSLADRDLLDLYRVMVLSRNLDERIWMLNRQGKAAIVASAQGHEAAQAACVWATDPSRDHYLIYYRDLCTMLALGVTPEELLRGFLARDGEPLSGARQFPLHGAHPKIGVVSFSNVVATQMPQAVGFALADKMRGSDAVTVAHFGDGASSMGDSHEAMNFAGIHRLPVIFFCENNHYAISVPQRRQMAIESIASRAAGYGFPGIAVDGMDAAAVFEAVSAAADRARSGQGPTLVEVKVDRFFPHTSDDDHTRYRDADEILHMRDRDPVLITETHLRNRGALDDALRNQIWSEAKQAVNEATEAAESAPFPSVDTLHDHLFAAAHDR